MANFSYTQNGILFNKLDNAPKPIKTFGGKLFNTNNDYEYASEDGIKFSLDAITLDWNGAQLKNGSTVKATLNTTGEGLSKLKIAI